MQKLSKKQERLLAVSLLVGIIIFFCVIVFIPWYNSLNETLEQIDDQVYRIQRYQRVIASHDEVLSKVDQGREEINALGYLYMQRTYSLAAANLQKRVKEISESADGEISSTQVLPNKEQDNLVQITVKVRLVGDMDMLRSLLYGIQAEKPLMSIENISIIPKRGKRNKKTRKMEESGQLTITMEVSSYMRKKSDSTE